MSVRDFHNKAMEYANNALAAQRIGQEGYAKLLFHKAYICETTAAQQLEARQENEPSRAILYRSAAWMAANAGDYRVAFDLATEGLRGEVSEQFRFELNEVLKHARLRFIP